MDQLSAQAKDIFYNVDSKLFHVVNDFLALTTVVAILGIVLETVPSFAPYSSTLMYIEYTAVAIFTIEYFGRIIANKGHIRKYMFGYFGIIDFFSIVPTFLSFSNLLFLKSIRIVRILRFLRMVRLAKISRLSEEFPIDPEEQAHLYKLSVRIYFFALLCSVTIFGTLIYAAEGFRPEFASIPLGMMWATKVTLGGVAQHMPQTTLGDFVAIAARFSGLALFGILISIIGGSLRFILFGTRDI